MGFDPRRGILESDGVSGAGAVLYWMSRDQRIRDNWALLHAKDIASENRKPLDVVFCLADGFLAAGEPHYAFMLGGLRQAAAELKKANVSFTLLCGDPVKEIPRFVSENRIHTLVSDFDPLRVKVQWRKKVAERIDVPYYVVDAHNVVPCWLASQKKEFAAYTFRPKITALLGEFLTDFPRMGGHRYGVAEEVADWGTRFRSENVFVAGEVAALKAVKKFASNGLSRYLLRNDPNADAQSGLSPYLHFGQVSAQRIAYSVMGRPHSEEFLEELVVRRELSDNFCHYEPDYACFDGFPDWGKKTLTEHAGDSREYVYSLKELESASTHDSLWNAAQTQMMVSGKMHGYMRMYWAKKILEWSENPHVAMEYATSLNDSYSLDGRDPNGYAGIAWSIGGVHDRAFRERPVYGKIRYMNRKGCERKFDVEEYIGNWQ